MTAKGPSDCRTGVFNRYSREGGSGCKFSNGDRPNTTNGSGHGSGVFNSLTARNASLAIEKMVTLDHNPSGVYKDGTKCNGGQEKVQKVESVGSQWERGSCGATRGGGTPVIKLGASKELGANVPESTMDFQFFRTSG